MTRLNAARFDLYEYDVIVCYLSVVLIPPESFMWMTLLRGN